MLYILVGRHGKPSMSTLFAWMKEEGVECTLITQTIKGLHYINTNGATGKVNEFFRMNKNDILFRWGSRAHIYAGDQVELNTSKSLKLSSNKLLFRKTMMENGCKVPLTVFDTKSLSDLNYKNGIVIRPSKHRAGKNYFIADNQHQAMRIIRNNKDVLASFYASEAINKKAEYRVHVAFGKIIVIKEKPKPDGDNDLRNPWNHALNDDDWHYIPWGEYNLQMVEACLEAVKTIGIDVAAVDVIVDENDEVFILESNTAPTLSPYAINRLAHLFKGMLKGYINPLQFRDFKSDVAKDYVWKNKELKIIK